MSSSSTKPLVLSDADTDALLQALEWRYAITPAGELAPKPAISYNKLPLCHLVKREDRFVTEITTQSNWTRNLVQNDVLWNNLDFDAYRTLAQCKMLFPHMTNEAHTPQPGSSVRKILNLVQCEAKAHFSLVQTMKIEQPLEQKLHLAIAPWPENKDSCYEALDKIFCAYGFLVPSKITLGECSIARHSERPFHHLLMLLFLFSGKKKIVSQDYIEEEGRSKSASMLAKAQANKELSLMNSVEDLKRSHVVSQPEDISRKSSYDLLLYDQKNTETRFEFWDIIKRLELLPIYDLLPSELGRKVKAILNERWIPIQIGDAIRLKNVATSAYLAARADGQSVELGLCEPASDSSLKQFSQWRLRRPDSVKVVSTQVKYGHNIFIEAVFGPIDSDMCFILSPRLSEEGNKEQHDLTLTQNKDWNESSSWLIESTLPLSEPESLDMMISQAKPLINGDIICISQNRLARYLSSKKAPETLADIPPTARRRSSSFGNAATVMQRFRRMSITRSSFATSSSAVEWGKLQLRECGIAATEDAEKWYIYVDKVDHFAKISREPVLEAKGPIEPPPRQSGTPRFISTSKELPVHRASTELSFQELGENLLTDSDIITTTTTDASSFGVSQITTVSLKSFRSASLPSPSMSAVSWDLRNNYDGPIFKLLKDKKPFTDRAKEFFTKASLISLRDIGRRFK
ncbi:hypothetical protein K450DRAFT_225791 [Umbelopsis ramanniana AG]|uniref:Uncharacterized protein n=1 Tax=Umbelopsis ramanniana AG TaxID=1314678 RepID=A0AAD5HHE6_UMBRA|nr:uncharacterized protein K450DRAFT_225791 [Umbelopsis ramanniana AG]KAI8582989.1 hypothetical protein K450DRAFT_225791 [Umbelopsis ramanniana AG]